MSDQYDPDWWAVRDLGPHFPAVLPLEPIETVQADNWSEGNEYIFYFSWPDWAFIQDEARWEGLSSRTVLEMPRSLRFKIKDISEEQTKRPTDNELWDTTKAPSYYGPSYDFRVKVVCILP